MIGFLAAPSLTAQNTHKVNKNPKVESESKVKAKKDKKSPEDIAKMRTERMTEYLDLNKRQADRAYGIILQGVRDRQALRENKELSKEEYQIASAKLVTDKNKNLKKILNDEQMEKYLETKAAMKERKGKHNKGKHKGEKMRPAKGEAMPH